MPLAKNNTPKAEIYALDAQGNTLAIYEIKVIDGQHELNCSERLIYGSSRLGMSKKIVNLGSQSGFDMQKMENSIYEFLDPQNAVANAVYVHPGFEKMYLGFKQYELNNHLGNVLSTVSDRKLTKRISDSQVYYVPDVRSATEYYPFGSMLEGWGCSQSFDCNLNTYSFTDTLLSDSYNTGLLSDLIKYPYYDYALITGSSVSYYTEISGNRYLVFNSTTRNQPIMRRIYGVEDYKTYTARFRGRVTSGSAEITVRKYLKSDSTVYSNATSKVVSLNGTWKTDSISFTVDPLYRYTVHVRNSASIGATSINIDFIEVYGEASASYLTCSEDSVGYRYGYQGQLKVDEVYGSGNLYSFDFRESDPRLGGQFWSIAPLAKAYPGWSPYAFAQRRPIDGIELEGLEWKSTNDDNGTPNGYQWAPDNAWNTDADGNKTLKEGYYHQAIFFSENGTHDASSKFNMGSSTATVFKADGTTQAFNASTLPSDLNKYPTVPEGNYEAMVGLHCGGSGKCYTALRMSDIGTTNFKNSRIELGFENPAFSDGRTYAKGINIHKPGINNQTGMTRSGSPISAGYSLIDLNSWDNFIGLFDNDAQRNNVIGVTMSRTYAQPVISKYTAPQLPYLNKSYFINQPDKSRVAIPIYLQLKMKK